MTTEFPHTEEIKVILKNKSDLVRQYGLNYLIPKWKRFTDNNADNEDLIYDWLNEMDARKIIDEILVILPPPLPHESFRVAQSKSIKNIKNATVVVYFKYNEMNREITICDECESEYHKDSSEMMGLCPDCAHNLYGYPNCEHEFVNEKCIKCGWNRKTSEYLKNRGKKDGN